MGPVDRFKLTLRIFGDELDPAAITAMLHCTPTEAVAKGQGPHPGFPRTGRWRLRIESKDCNDCDVDDGIKILLDKLPSDPQIWAHLTANYKVDIFCGLFLASDNRGFGLSVETSKLLVDRHLSIGFDIYFDRPET